MNRNWFFALAAVLYGLSLAFTYSRTSEGSDFTRYPARNSPLDKLYTTDYGSVKTFVVEEHRCVFLDTKYGSDLECF